MNDTLKQYEKLRGICKEVKYDATKATLALEELNKYKDPSPRKFNRHKKDFDKHVGKYMQKLAETSPYAIKLIFEIAENCLDNYIKEENAK